MVFVGSLLTMVFLAAGWIFSALRERASRMDESVANRHRALEIKANLMQAREILNYHQEAVQSLEEKIGQWRHELYSAQVNPTLVTALKEIEPSFDALISEIKNLYSGLDARAPYYPQFVRTEPSIQHHLSMIQQALARVRQSYDRPTGAYHERTLMKLQTIETALFSLMASLRESDHLLKHISTLLPPQGNR